MWSGQLQIGKEVKAYEYVTQTNCEIHEIVLRSDHWKWGKDDFYLGKTSYGVITKCLDIIFNQL